MRRGGSAPLVLLVAVTACPGDDGSGTGDDATTTVMTGGPTSSPTSSAPTSVDSTGPAPETSSTTGEPTTVGPSDGTDATSSTTGAPVGQRMLLAVGYGGMRVRSLDDGFTWEDYTQLVDNGADDQELLRGCASGAGRFAAAGWRIFSSADGVEWEEHDNPTGQWLGALAFGNDLFLGVGGGGYCARSDDGMNWETCTDVTDDGGFEHVRSTVFLDGLFYTADADGDVRSSPDGNSWSFVENLGTAWVAVEDGAIVPREESAPADFVDLRLRATIERADAGSEDFSSVFTAQNGNGVFQAYRFAFCEGYVEK